MNKYNLAVISLISIIFFINLVNATQISDEIAYWNFDEGNSNILNDNSGNNYDGVISGDALWVDGVTGNALNFDGIYDYIEIQNTSDLHFHSGFTLSAWVKFNNYNFDNFIIGKHISGIVSGYFLGVQDNKFDFYVNNAPLPGNKQRLRTSQSYNDNKWHHVVGVYDGTSQYLYVDGSLVAHQEQEYLSINSANIRIGGIFQGENNGAFIGNIDEVRIYDRALSEEEVYELSNPQQELNLEERVEVLEQKVEELEDRINVLEILIDKIKHYFWFMPTSIKKNILCWTLEDSGETEIEDFGLRCELKQLWNRNRCVCKKA